MKILTLLAKQFRQLLLVKEYSRGGSGSAGDGVQAWGTFPLLW
ncbi:MAG: hypothetical protein V8Q57_05750 [Blautia sp.]